MQEFQVKIKGVTPLMQHRMDDTKLESWEKSRGHIIERADVSHEDAVRAEFHSYFQQENSPEKGFYYIPSEHIRGALIGAGSYVKSKVGTRSKSMKVIVAAMFQVFPEQIPIPHFDAIDKRSAVNKNVKARVIVVRPKWTEWEAEFLLQIGEDSITKETITELFRTAGDYVGIGSFRPEHNGSFGRFKLVELKKLK